MTAKALFLHVGFHRTGTSSLQNYLWEVRDVLREHGVCYPDAALSGPTHGKLANVLKGKASRRFLQKMRPLPTAKEFDPYRISRAETAERLYGDLFSALNASRCRIGVVSSECFLECVNPKDVARYVMNRGFDIKVIIYVRQQDDWIQSVFNQIIKDRFLRYFGEFDDIPQHSQLNYGAILDDWADAFGLENILVRVYEKAQLLGGDIVTDFLSLLELNREVLSPQATQRHDNASLHREIVAILRDVNRLTVSRREHEIILNALLPLSAELVAEDGSSGFDILSSSQKDNILDKFREDNEYIARKYLNRPDGRLFLKSNEMI